MSEEDTTVDETQDVEGNESDDSADVLETLGEDDLRKEIKKLRRESAKHRTKNAAKDAELEEFRVWKDSQLTELEKAQKRAGELQSELSKFQLKDNQEKAAKKAGLDPELSDRVRGDSFEDMVAD